MSAHEGIATGTGIHFREATAADHAPLIALINSAFAVETFLDGPRIDEKRLAEMMDKSSILLAEDGDGRFLASVYMERRGAHGYLGMLAVIPARQREGLGRKTMEAAEDRFRRMGCEAAEITVLSLRPELPPIYRKFGYIETGREEFPPSVPLQQGLECHCIVMTKQL